ncbi:S-layer homology domain-containing protein [Robertmurraya siralis]|uniref:S-layer homology domain-containing protein n=1 Tax=Robertmurraya siralis TaxID=77777 RepID=UPI0010F63697|nr:S-layer homology domain-containing protein [Robertmurraya siralis]
MAYQPKSYRKFVATAATATLVASAVAPAAAAGFTDVSDNYKEAVDFVVSKGAKGLTETKFGVSENIKRVDAAVLLANVLELDTEKAPAAGFTDVPARAQGAVNALKAAGITNGKSDTKFGANDLITRGELAIWIQKGFGLEGKADIKFTDVGSRYTEAVAALVANKITQGKNPTQFGTADNAKRGDYAIFLHRADQAQSPATPEVVGVTAVNPTTLSFTGTGLKSLKAENITVEGNTVTAVSSTDGKTATVSLGGTLPVSKDVKVTVKSGEVTKEFTVNYALEAKKVAIKDAIFDDDTNGQKLTVLVDGVETSVDYLLSAGYSVVFNAYDKDGKVANTELFGTTGDVASTTGQLKNNSPINLGEYTVTVVIAKGSTILTSEAAKITVRNIDNAATAITKYEFILDKGAAGVSTEDFELNSKTLVIGEKAYIGTVTLGVGSAATEISGVGTGSIVEYKSSNPAVVSVDSTSKSITAEGVGTATITMTVGKVSQTFTITVKGEQRKAVKVNASNSTHIVNRAISKSFDVVDQYGDPFDGVTDLEVVAPVSVAGFDANPKPVTASKGTATVAIGTPTTAGQSGTVVVRNANTKATVGSFLIKTTAQDSVASTKLAIASSSKSKDEILNADLASDNTLTYILRDYTSENVVVKSYGAADYTDYVVRFNGSVVSVNGDTTGEYTLTATDENIHLAITGAGSTTVSVFDASGKLVDSKVVTVKQAATKITSVNWKTVPVINYTTEINYKTVLDITEGVNGTDSIVKGITLSSPVANAIRIAENSPAGTFEVGDIYIDRNDNGVADAGDTLIGKLTYSATSTSTGALVPLIGSPVDGTEKTSLAVGTPAKGYLNFVITDETSSDSVKPVVSTKSVEVDVK